MVNNSINVHPTDQISAAVVTPPVISITSGAIQYGDPPTLSLNCCGEEGDTILLLLGDFQRPFSGVVSNAS